MKLSNIGQVNPVMTGSILDATTPKTELTKNTVKLGGGPDVSTLLILGGVLFFVFAITSASPPPKGGTIRGY